MGPRCGPPLNLSAAGATNNGSLAPGSAGKGGWIGGHHASVTPASGRFGRARLRIDRKRERRRRANCWPRRRWQGGDCRRFPEPQHDCGRSPELQPDRGHTPEPRHGCGRSPGPQSDTLRCRLAASARHARARYARARSTARFRIAVQFTADHTTRCICPGGDSVDHGSDARPGRAACSCSQEIAKSGTQRQ
jgi:hypothetical protein